MVHKLLHCQKDSIQFYLLMGLIVEAILYTAIIITLLVTFNKINSIVTKNVLNKTDRIYVCAFIITSILSMFSCAGYMRCIYGSDDRINSWSVILADQIYFDSVYFFFALFYRRIQH
eukprot:510468_1